MYNFRTLLVPIIIGLLSQCTGCASMNRAPDPHDPLENLNRVTYGLNRALDVTVTRPVAWTYKTFVPFPARYGIGNFLSNMTLVSTVVNDVLQFRLKQAMSDAARFVVNSTLGVVGVFDVAKYLGLVNHSSDIGETFYTWGWRESSYLVVPLFGPSTVRDMLGRAPTMYLSPLQLIGPGSRYRGTASYGSIALGIIHGRAEFMDKESIVFVSATDEYAAIRNIYLQHRNYKLHKDLNISPAVQDAITGDSPFSNDLEPQTPEDENMLSEPPE